MSPPLDRLRALSVVWTPGQLLHRNPEAFLRLEPALARARQHLPARLALFQLVNSSASTALYGSATLSGSPALFRLVSPSSDSPVLFLLVNLSRLASPLPESPVLSRAGW